MDKEEVRNILYDFYKSNIKNNIGFVISVIIGFLGILNIEQLSNFIFQNSLIKFIYLRAQADSIIVSFWANEILFS